MKILTIIILFITMTFTGTNSASPGDVRLVNGKTSMEGRVEIFHNGQWGTVCEDYWDARDARVVCRQLGLLNTMQNASVGYFGAGSGPIWLDDVRCNGTESELSECTSLKWNRSDCVHYLDAGVRCNDAGLEAGKAVRLVNGKNAMEGRVEIFHDGEWGTVCDDFWDIKDAGVVCRQLGFMEALFAIDNAYFGAGTGPIWLDDTQCSGTESELSYCIGTNWNQTDCDHYEDAGVRSTSTPPLQTVRLTYGNHFARGIVQVLHNGSWGVVCDDNWGQADAQVVCRQLGFEGATTFYDSFYIGFGPIWLDDVQCAGNESRLEDCTHQGLGDHDCTDCENVGVVCDLGCDVGFFGHLCTECHCQLGHSCSPVNGECTSGTECAPGWGDFPFCQTACEVGQFGVECEGTCHCIGACDNRTGNCDRKGCVPGWISEEFKLSYQIECPSGEFGRNCAEVCHCFDNSKCDKTNGSCQGQPCQAGWQSAQGKDDCQQECPAGRFGSGCIGTCHCNDAVHCLKENGTCPKSGCQPGWMGESCQQVCQPGTYGINCGSNCICVNSMSCSPQDGACEGQAQGLSNEWILGISAGGSCLILLLCGIGICVYQKRTSHRIDMYNHPHHDEPRKEKTEYLPTNRRSEALYEEVKEYENIGNEDGDKTTTNAGSRYVNPSFITEENSGENTDKDQTRESEAYDNNYANIGKSDVACRLENPYVAPAMDNKNVADNNTPTDYAALAHN